MSPAVPGYVWVVTLGADVWLILGITEMVRRFARKQPNQRALVTGVVLTLWFVAALALAGSGMLRGGPGRPPPVGLGVGFPILVGGLALAFSPSARAFVAGMPQPWLIGLQAVRMLGLVFIAMEARGVLPAHFAEPAGWGDFVVGATAPLVAYATSRQSRGARWFAVTWNCVGLADLIVAVSLGALTAESSIRVFFTIPSTDAMSVLPLAMIPAFGVPLFVLLHIASLIGLRRQAPSRAARAEQRRPPPLGTPEAHA
jgi:hypothetical protein